MFTYQAGSVSLNHRPISDPAPGKEVWIESLVKDKVSK